MRFLGQFRVHSRGDKAASYPSAVSTADLGKITSVLLPAQSVRAAWLSAILDDSSLTHRREGEGKLQHLSKRDGTNGEVILSAFLATFTAIAADHAVACQSNTAPFDQFH